MSALVVKACGPMTTLQDAGRIGAARLGLSRSGAMDRLALAEANALVGNGPGEGAIELMLAGATFVAEDGPVRLAVAGAAMPVSRDGAAIAPATSFVLPQGGAVTIGPAAAGIFAYLAIAGGLAVEPALGSVSLQPRAAIGGLDGRPLRAGDRLPLKAETVSAGPDLSLDPWKPDPAAPIRVVLGPQDDHFPPEAIAAFLSNAYAISDEADRMGYRLTGAPIAHLHGYNIVSDGLVGGSIQVPGSGVPIVLMADHQTTGGYPKIATVISADLGALAQRRVGAAVRFEAVDVATAQRVARDRAGRIAALPSRLRRARDLPDVEELLGLNLAGAAIDALAAPGP